MANGTCTYEYKCKECGQVIAQEHRFAHHPSEIACPLCQGEAPRFFGTAPPIFFRGVGWSKKNLTDPMDTSDPRNDPLFFDDLIERREGLTPTTHYT